GAVEIGGWAPYFRTNPPESLLGDLAEHQVDVVIALAEMLPRVALEAPTVKRLASGLYEIRTALTNDGALPTGTAMAVRNRRARPHVVRVGLPVDRIMHGQRVNKVWSIAGSGGRVPFRWIVRADDGAVVPLTVFSEKYGQFTVDVTLEETN
ncbi:MAG: hypothetical protein KDA25_08660, partial [Phycisphaerales bacterium]|nr:hypothetical protein [Phycisphaerales bacterium]